MTEPHHSDHGHAGHSGSGHMHMQPVSEIDTSHIDHSQHSAHDMHHSMSMSNMGTSMNMMMSMYFHFGYDETILFEFWKISSVSGLVGSMIGLFFMAALYEGLKYYREYLFWKTYNSLQYRSVETPATKNAMPEDNTVAQPTMLSMSHAFQTVLHIIQIVISYFLMLVFMTYNVWLCLAVAVGAGVGYFLFGWKKSVIIDVTEHCH